MRYLKGTNKMKNHGLALEHTHNEDIGQVLKMMARVHLDMFSLRERMLSLAHLIKRNNSPSFPTEAEYVLATEASSEAFWLR